ncbi:DNA-formamidopyrimidine glycosylase [Ligilactobacillus ceti]|uniref:Formamidopyrimidine-DNA glycosylase n=1 Tax=Ligilactobacillus ceti DSM 22408 TaxID=1122146 RepID=A0A0R2KGX1_9LACO|nr:DNA-formamidopyrimidine glycosylase [Ligilactobacillus ceti]KRN88523.1 formamidopyrimidine-DNA glycosylase [Ligilactobacillus ceti DSM 22408]
MPELPEVETVRRGLNKLVLGQVVTDVNVVFENIIVGDPQEFVAQLKGKTLEKIDRRGKYLLFRFSDGITMVSHLRMEGKYFVKDGQEPLEKHSHIIFKLANGKELRYNDVRKFGRMELIATGHENEFKNLAKLGVEPTPTAFKVDEFYQALQKKNKGIKSALLDQTIVVGLGNIYVDEVLWMSQIHPETKANHLTLAEATVLHDNIIAELAEAVKAGGTTVRSYADAFQNSGSFQFALQVYGKQGEPCPRCRTPIEKIRVAQRGTHFCPQCQQVK